MKKSIINPLVIILIAGLTSCGINNAYLLNQNQNSTQVHLSEKNYQVVEKVSGSADVSYVLIFGGAGKKKLFDNAYSDMVDKANLSEGSRALVNLVTEEHVGGLPPFFTRRTVTVSAHVVEFTK